MATAPAPVLTLTGTARAVERFERVTNRETGESTPSARVTVLTDLGGFVEVFVREELLGLLPANVDRLAPAPVAWLVEVGAWNREAWGQDEVPRDQRRRYAALSVRLVGLADKSSKALAVSA